MNRFNAALVVRWIVSLLWHLLNVIIWIIYEATKLNGDENDDDSVIAQDDATKDDEEDEFKDRNHLWFLHGLYFMSFILAFLSLIFVQTFNININNSENNSNIHENQNHDPQLPDKPSNVDLLKLETQLIGQRFSYNGQYFWKQLKYDVMSLNI